MQKNEGVGETEESNKLQKIIQKDLVIEYFSERPNQEISQREAAIWLAQNYLNRTGKHFADPQRQVRKLHQEGFLQNPRKGVYQYDPSLIESRNLEDFTPEQKEEIFKKDQYKCVVCGKGRADGIDIQADHIKPKDKGGKAELTNGQTLCSQHNFIKKNYNATETGKRMFIKLLELAEHSNDDKTREFCKDVLKMYEKHDINGHIEWND